METENNHKKELSKEELLELQQDREDANKALSLASWSYVGLFIPLLGWILAGYSLSLSSTLPRTGVIGRKVRSSRRNAKLSIWLSIIIVVLASVVYIFIIKEIVNQQEQQIQQPNKSGPDTCLKQAVDKRDTFVELGYLTWEEANNKLHDEQAACFRDYP